MPKVNTYRVTGLVKATGASIAQTIHSICHEGALREAERRGILVESVRLSTPTTDEPRAGYKGVLWRPLTPEKEVGKNTDRIAAESLSTSHIPTPRTPTPRTPTPPGQYHGLTFASIVAGIAAGVAALGAIAIPIAATATTGSAPPAWQVAESVIGMAFYTAGLVGISAACLALRDIARTIYAGRNR